MCSSHRLVHGSARTALVAAVILGALLAGGSGTAAQAAGQRPGCEAPVWGSEAETFAARIAEYVNLRTKLEIGLPPQKTSENPAETAETRQALAARIRTARANAKQGDLLTPALSVQIQRSLRLQMDPHTWKVIMDDNPGEFPSQVNDEYRVGQPLATMPPNVLRALPELAADIEYRFVERHLILLDTRANLILDRIPYAIRYADTQKSCR